MVEQRPPGRATGPVRDAVAGERIDLADGVSLTMTEAYPDPSASGSRLARSHLLLLEAVAGPDLVGHAYREAVQARYLWHEFGDSCLLLPPRRQRTRFIPVSGRG